MSARKHAEQSRQHIELAHEQQSRDGEFEFGVRDNALIAVAEATLALAEEQRTANLIAAFERDAIQPPHESTAANRPFWNALAVDITERLDLA